MINIIHIKKIDSIFFYIGSIFSSNPFDNCKIAIRFFFSQGLDFINAGTRLEDFFRKWKLISYPPKIFQKKFIPPCFYHFLFHTPLIFTISYFTPPFFRVLKFLAENLKISCIIVFVIQSKMYSFLAQVPKRNPYYCPPYR